MSQSMKGAFWMTTRLPQRYVPDGPLPALIRPVSPFAVRIGNSEWPKWQAVMSADPVDESELAALARNAPLTRPRPGHADLVGMQ